MSPFYAFRLPQAYGGAATPFGGVTAPCGGGAPGFARRRLRRPARPAAINRAAVPLPRKRTAVTARRQRAFFSIFGLNQFRYASVMLRTAPS